MAGANMAFTGHNLPLKHDNSPASDATSSRPLLAACPPCLLPACLPASLPVLPACLSSLSCLSSSPSFRPADGTRRFPQTSFPPSPDVTSGRRTKKVSPSPPPRVEPQTFSPYPDSCRRSEQLHKDLPAHVLAQIHSEHTPHQVRFKNLWLRRTRVVGFYMFGF